MCRLRRFSAELAEGPPPHQLPESPKRIVDRARLKGMGRTAAKLVHYGAMPENRRVLGHTFGAAPGVSGRLASGISHASE